jgi:ribose transport system substrate-binding protein
VVAVAAAVAGCGSSSSTASTSAADSAASTSNDAASSSTSSTGGSLAISAANGTAPAAGVPSTLAKMVQSWMKRPDSIGITTPVGKPIPKGKTIEYISCGGLACNDAGAEMQAGAAKLGWTVKTTTAATPAAFKAAVDAAIQQHVSALTYWSEPASTILPEFKELKAMKIPVVTTATTEPTDIGQASINNLSNPGILATIYPGSTIYATIAQLAEVAVYYGGTKANILDISPAGYSYTATQDALYTKTVAKWCPGCTVHHLDIPYSDIGPSSISEIVNEIRSTHATVLDTSTDDFVEGVPQALKANGVKVSTILTSAPTSASLEDIKSGVVTAGLAFATPETSWAALDALARYFAGVSVKPSVAPAPTWLITKSSVPGLSTFPVDANYQQAFEKLWGIS